jgi:Protein of unknown function (DUF1569)
MKSIFDKTIRDEVIDRINALTPESKPRWGKMTVEQMVRHCEICEEYYFGNVKVGRSFLGRIVGKMAIKSILKDENSSFRKNSQTRTVFLVTEDVKNLEEEKEKWKTLIRRYGTFDREDFTHWFFGKITKLQLGEFVYKHTDHHLKQFGV